MEAINKNDMLEKILKIHHVPGPYRTLDETTVFTTFLSNFDFFKSKVFDNSLNEVLELASKHLKYSKIPAGQFLYHHGQPSNCIYLILKGEAWKFRQKTEREVELDAILKQKISAPKNVPKILETIALAKAQNARNKLPVSVQSNNRPSIPTPLDRSPKLADRDRSPQRYGIGKEGINDTKYDEVKKTGRDDVIIENRNEPESAKIRQGNKIASIAASRKIGEGLLKKLKDTKEVMNFENDYLLNLIKRSPELSAKYIFDRNLNLKFERKFGALETLGEMSMSLNQMRTSSVLAYTDLHVFYLDQKSYEKVFFAQIDEIREKLNFFSEYFKEINFNTLKKVCFLFTEKKFKLGEIIYKEGNPRDNLYFIKSGEVQLVKRLTVEDDPYTNYSNDSNELDLTLLTPYQHKIEKNVLVASVSMGHFFGEEAISDEPLRHFTAKSISNLTCYVVSPQVLARLPEKVLHNLQEMSTSKQNWRGNRLENIKNQPLFKNIQKRLALGPIYHDQKTKSSRAESSESSVEKSFSQEQRKTERFITPKRKMDLSSTEYGFFQTKKPHGLSYCQETSKNEESNAQYKITARKSSIEKQLLDRNCLTSRGGRKSRFVIEQENQKTLDSLKYSLHPTSSRNQRKITTKTFEIRSESDSEESIDRNNPSFGILQTEELSDLNGEGFEYNFVTKTTKRKTSPQSNKLRPILADKKGNDTTKLNEESQKSKEIRSISTPKTQLNSETTLKKLKGSLLNLMNKEKANFYAKNSRPEIESMGYFMIKTCNPSQTKGFDSLKLNDDSKCISPKTNSMSISKFESSLSPKNKKTSLVLKDKSQMLHIQGNKFKAIF